MISKIIGALKKLGNPSWEALTATGSVEGNCEQLRKKGAIDRCVGDFLCYAGREIEARRSSNSAQTIALRIIFIEAYNNQKHAPPGSQEAWQKYCDLYTQLKEQQKRADVIIDESRADAQQASAHWRDPVSAAAVRQFGRNDEFAKILDDHQKVKKQTPQYDS